LWIDQRLYFQLSAAMMHDDQRLCYRKPGSRREHSVCTSSTFHVLAATVSATFKSRAALQLENLALQHQLGVIQGYMKRLNLRRAIDSYGRGGVGRLAVCAGHRQTGHGHRLAPQGLSSVLELEGPPR
jgi:hypothetical protein